MDQLNFGDAQSVPPVMLCDFCCGEIYKDDLVHYIDGYVICPECFDDFIFDYFADCMITGEELASLFKPENQH